MSCKYEGEDSLKDQVFGVKSLALEHISLFRLKQVYENFMKQKFSTTIQEDMGMIETAKTG